MKTATMPKHTRTILHVDMDAFFASVEQVDHPEYAGKPVIVGSPPDQRGVVSAASYEARKFGVHSAMPSRTAAQRCPDGIFLPVNGKRYKEISKQIFRIFETFTPWVEPLSIDEAFLDVSGSLHLFGEGPEIAEKIRTTIREQTGLTASVGIAPNKFLAKLASDMNKPDGLTLVPTNPAAIREFLAPLSVSRIWGLGKVAQKKLEKAGIRIVQDLQDIPDDVLARLVGERMADHYKALAYGVDERCLEMDVREKSVSREYTFTENCSDSDLLERVLSGLVDEVAARIRKENFWADVAVLKVRWEPFETITRQRKLDSPCRDTFTLLDEAFTLFRKEKLKAPVRLIGFGVRVLESRFARQIDLFDLEDRTAREKRERASLAMDKIRRMYGPQSLRRAGAHDTAP